jgi:hypothetical protein
MATLREELDRIAIEHVQRAIARRPSQPSCTHCGADTVELQPLGPDGSYICAPCSVLPELAPEVERQRQRQLEEAGQLGLFGGG